MTLPELYLIGAPKSGTTSLARWLSAHSDVYFSVPKEPFYWASDYPRLRSHYGFHTQKAYAALFDGEAARAAKWRAEGSTVYLYSEVAMRDIAAAVPQARFVLALRDPVDLVVSVHRTQLVALNEDEPDFIRAWRRCLAGGRPGTDPLDLKLVDYPRIGALGRAVERALQVVSRERLHIVTLDEMSRDPVRVWRSLTAFLDIDPAREPAFVTHNASGKMYRYPSLRRVTHRPPSGLEGPIRRLRQWSRTTSLLPVARVKQRMWRPESRPEISRAEREEVTEFFSRDVRLLSDLLGLDVSQ